MRVVGIGQVEHAIIRSLYIRPGNGYSCIVSYFKFKYEYHIKDLKNCTNAVSLEFHFVNNRTT